MRLDWAQRRSVEFEQLDPEKSIAILPTAAIEQHGPHLPVGTDTMIMQGMLERFRNNCSAILTHGYCPYRQSGNPMNTYGPEVH